MKGGWQGCIASKASLHYPAMSDNSSDHRKLKDKSILVSVIIPVWDNPDGLRRCLRALIGQSYPAELIEIIVVDVGVNETVKPLKSEFPGVKWLWEPKRSSFIARNQGIAKANGEILAFTEADCHPHEAWLANGVEQLGRPGAPDIISGKTELDFPRSKSLSTLEWYQLIVGFTQEDNIRSGRDGSTANLMTAADVFEKVGLFYGRFQIDGALYWVQSAARAGCTIAYAGDVSVGRSLKPSLAALVAKAKRQARESLIQDNKGKSSRLHLVWESLRLFFPDFQQLRNMFRLRGGLPLIKLPAVFCLSWMLRIITALQRTMAGTRDIMVRVKSLARAVAPYPKAWAIITGKRVPAFSIAGRKAGLNRPESISFSPYTPFIGVSNSEGHSIGFFSAVDAGGNTYSAIPDGIISNADCLNYIHDFALSPCGSYIATVAREAHALALFDQAGSTKDGKECEPSWTIQGRESGLNFPAGVAIHPSGNFIAVANRVFNGITLYRKSVETGGFESVPFQSITEEDSLSVDLSSPHGLDFSPDGKFLAVVHKRFPNWANVGGGQSGLAIYRWREGPEQGLEPIPVAIRTYANKKMHSVSVHPSGTLIAVTDEEMGVEIVQYSSQDESLSIADTCPVFRVGPSVKGVGFSRDGKRFAVTCDMNEILFFNTPASLFSPPLAVSN